MLFFFYGYGDNLDLHVLNHSVPPRRASDLAVKGEACEVLVSGSDDGTAIVWHPLNGKQPIDRLTGSILSILNSSPCVCFLGRTPSSFSTALRSEEHTSELQSLMRISYAVFCLKKKTNNYY